MPLKAMSREELQQSEEPSQYPATSRLFTHMSKALSIAAVCGVILVIACVFRVDKVQRSQASESMEKLWDQKDASGQCGLMEKDMDYVEYSGWGKNLDHIPDPDMCCAFCQAEPKCKSFAWVEDAGLDGCPSQCWLKGGEPSDKKPKDGVISGLPPPRQAFHIAPQEASPDQFPVRRAGMFCFSLMLPFGYEVELLAWQYAHQVSIFDCEKFAVYTNKSMEVGSGTGLFTHVVDSNLHCQVGGDSQSALNSWIFIAVWKKVLSDGYWREYPWTVKVDPDAVFLPLRARPILMQYYGEPYINNCHYGMHGPVEFFGQPAMAALNGEYEASYDGKAPKACVEELHFGLWGEDMFMDQCLRKVLQVTNGEPPALAPELMCEAHCDCPEWIWCSGDQVSFHPFKSIDSYKNCMANVFATGNIRKK